VTHKGKEVKLSFFLTLGYGLVPENVDVCSHFCGVRLKPVDLTTAWPPQPQIRTLSTRDYQRETGNEKEKERGIEMKSEETQIVGYRRRGRSRWAAALVASAAIGAILGGALPASASDFYVNGSVAGSTYKHYYATWRSHTNGYASFTLNATNVPGLCGGAMRYALWDGVGGETPLLYFTTTGVNKPFTWPNGGYVLPTQTYAMIDGNSGGACGTITWYGYLNL